MKLNRTITRKIVTFVLALVFISASALKAQAPATAPKGTTGPHISTTFKRAAQAIIADFNNVQTEVVDFQNDIKVAYPGYHFNFGTGELEKDAPAAKPDAAKPTAPAPAPASTKK